MMTLKSARVQCVVCMLCACLLTDALPAAEFAGGTGEPNDPYQIGTAEQLVSIGSDPNLLDKHFVLIADIDLDSNLPGGEVFDTAVVAPVVETSGPFMEAAFWGVFDGDDHKISNLTIRGGSHLGLFGVVLGVVRNVELVDADISGSGDYVGALIGHNAGTVVQCHSDGTVAGGRSVGGLAGACGEDGIIVLSYSTGSVEGRDWVGGLVGCNEGGIVSLGYSTSAVSGSEYVGGLIGFNRGGSLVHCYSAGVVTGQGQAGGLAGVSHRAGRSRGGAVVGCFWDTEASGLTTSAAGKGVTTAQMQDVSTFLAAGWDAVDEVANGTCDFWRISEGRYPQLRCCGEDRPVMPEGSGTTAEPYLIRDARDLGTVWSQPGACYRLEASIDLSGIAWSSAVVPWFAGGFDGNGCAISNLSIQGNRFVALFGQSGPGATISNLGLERVDVNGVGNYVGGLVGDNRGDITSCHSAGTVAGAWYVGGLVGDNKGNITASYSEGTVRGEAYEVGGLVGRNSGSITSCHSAGQVSGEWVGGLVGSNEGGSIAASSSTADVNGGQSEIGGLVGSHSNQIAWGPGGSVEVHSGMIAESFSSGAVTGVYTVGGLVGKNSADVIASYSNSSVAGANYVGGLVGYSSSGSILASCCTGAVAGNSYVGGLIGAGWANQVTASFWDIETSGQAASLAGTGKTTVEMQMAATFLDAGWDFTSTWSICEGKDYPRLQWEGIDCGE
ncbi:MAG: GLUG motif-containing protein [Phycisphaerales bacterium]